MAPPTAGAAAKSDHAAAAKQLSALTTVGDLRAALGNVSDAELAAGLERLALAGKVQVFGDVDIARLHETGGVMIGSQPVSTVMPRGTVTAGDVREAFQTVKPEDRPGFTGTDALGREWRDGKLVAKAKEETLPLEAHGPAGTGTEKEIATAALFLCAPANTYLTGQTVVVDGGASIQ